MKRRNIQILCWTSFFEHLLSRGNELDNVECAFDLNVGDIITFVRYENPYDYIVRSVVCKLSDGAYTIQNNGFRIMDGVIQQRPHFNSQRAVPLELDERAKNRRRKRGKQ